MAIPAGKAFVELSIVGEAAMAAKMSTIKARLAKFGPAVAVAGAAAAAAIAVASVKAFADITKASITAATAFNEVKSKFKVVFGEMSGDMEQFSRDFGSAVGRSQKQTIEMLAGIQDLLVPMGVLPGQAAELSKAVSMLAVDLASFNNKQDADVMNDLQAALTGSGEVMKKYGVVLTETSVKQELLNQGLDPKHATNAQKAIARLNIILAGTTAAQGDALRTSDSLANQQKRLKAATDDLMVTYGSQFIPILEQLMAVLLGVLDVVSGPIEGELDKLGDAAQNNVSSFGELSDAIETMVSMLSLAAGPMLQSNAILGYIAAGAKRTMAALAELNATRLRIQGDTEAATAMKGLATMAKAEAAATSRKADEMFERGSNLITMGLGGEVGGKTLGDRVADQMAESKKRREDILAQQKDLYKPIDMGDESPFSVVERAKQDAAAAAEKQKKIEEEKAAELERQRDEKRRQADELDRQYNDLFAKQVDSLEAMDEAPTDPGQLESISASSISAFETFKANADCAASFQERQTKLAEEQVRLGKSMEKILKERQLIVGSL